MGGWEWGWGWGGAGGGRKDPDVGSMGVMSWDEWPKADFVGLVSWSECLTGMSYSRYYGPTLLKSIS